MNKNKRSCIPLFDSYHYLLSFLASLLLQRLVNIKPICIQYWMECSGGRVIKKFHRFDDHCSEAWSILQILLLFLFALFFHFNCSPKVCFRFCTKSLPTVSSRIAVSRIIFLTTRDNS